MDLESIIKMQSRERIKVIKIVLVLAAISAIAIIGAFNYWGLIYIFVIYTPLIIYPTVKAFLWNKKYINVLKEQLAKYKLKDIKIIDDDMKDNGLIKYFSPNKDISISVSPTWFVLTTTRHDIIIRKTEEIEKISKTQIERRRLKDGVWSSLEVFLPMTENSPPLVYGHILMK